MGVLAFALVASGASIVIAPAAGAADGGLRSDHPIVSFYPQRVGTVRRAPDTISLSNTGASSVKFGQWVFTGANPDEFSESDDCVSVLLPAEACHVIVWHSPLHAGPQQATLVISDLSSGTHVSIDVWGQGTVGYYVATAAGTVHGSGDANPDPLSFAPVVWRLPAGLARPIDAMAATPSGAGVWLAAADGGIFTFGDAAFYGSTGGIRLNQPVVGMAATPTGRGYWPVAADGGIFTFGDAAYYGSTGAVHLDRPVVGIAASPSGGYWLVASDGGVFAFGHAPFFGSRPSTFSSPAAPPYRIVGIAGMPDGSGYWVLTSSGITESFGGAPEVDYPIGALDPVAVAGSARLTGW